MYKVVDCQMPSRFLNYQAVSFCVAIWRTHMFNRLLFPSFLLLCFFFFFFSSAQLSKKWFRLNNRADGMARGILFLLLLHDEPWQPCHRLICRFLSPHSPLYWGKLGIESVQVNIQKQTGHLWGLGTQHVSGMRPQSHECVKQARSCMFFQCVGHMGIFIFFNFRNHGEKHGWQIAFFCFAFFS